MKLTYEMIFSILNSKYGLVKGEEKDYFLDDSGRIVATIDKNLITMFYSFPSHSREIWNHEGNVAIAFARDFNVNGQICDILCIEGLCGACNDFSIHEDFSIDTMNNGEMRYLLDKNENPLQKQFEAMSYKERISVLESSTGAQFTGANIEGVQLFADSDKYALGNCGHLSSHNGIASFDICGVVKVDNMVVNKKYDGYDINNINFKNIQKDTNYKEIYKYYRQENDWYYDKEKGYNTAGSYETRAFTERRRYSTVDKDAIHTPKTTKIVFNSILDPIYENGNQSLNAKRLQMIYTLNLLLNNKKMSTDYVSSHYNFNVRNCDMVRQRVKR